MRLSSTVKLTLIITASVLIGILAGSMLLSAVPGKSSAGTENDGLTFSGTINVKVLASDGSVVSQYTGPDPLEAAGINAIAACITGTDGGSTSPIGPGSVDGYAGSCSSFVNAVAIVFSPYQSVGGTCAQPGGSQTENGFSVSGCEENIAATNTLTPLGCGPNGSTGAPLPLCSGWITEATFGPTTFTATNCVYTTSQTPCAVTSVGTGVLSQLTSYGYTNAFSAINLGATPIQVAAGDSLLVTIQFTVS